MPCIISWSLGISLKCSLHYLLLVPLSVVLNMIRGDLSEWILDTHSQIIQLMECLQTPQVGLFLRINLAKKDSIKVLAGRNGYCSATKATTAELSIAFFSLFPSNFFLQDISDIWNRTSFVAGTPLRFPGIEKLVKDSRAGLLDIRIIQGHLANR